MLALLGLRSGGSLFFATVDGKLRFLPPSFPCGCLRAQLALLAEKAAKASAFAAAGRRREHDRLPLFLA